MSKVDLDRRYGGFYKYESVDVTGQTFINAVFKNCIIERRLTGECRPTLLYSCVFD